jgi:hypothetical protein
VTPCPICAGLGYYADSTGKHPCKCQAPESGMKYPISETACLLRPCSEADQKQIHSMSRILGQGQPDTEGEDGGGF